MLELAVKANLPVIGATTTDPVNLGAVLHAATGKVANVFDCSARDLSLPLGTRLQPGTLYYAYDPPQTVNWLLVYQAFVTKKSTLVVVNPKQMHCVMFDVGAIRVPKKMVRDFVKKYASDDKFEDVYRALSGLSYKDVIEVSKLAMTAHGEYTPRAIRAIRQAHYGAVRGLQQVSTDYLHYEPQMDLMKWVATHGSLLKLDAPELLTPRGLLFCGPPGTGKTMGAKYIAKTLDLPLYMLEIGSVMSKWHGESDENLRTALNQAELNEPCILLIDEVEKLFKGTDDSGISTRLLAYLLWWLQEHKTKVFTIMTTNDQASIPPELVRPGRLDRIIEFFRLDHLQAAKFIAVLVAKLGKAVGVTGIDAKEILVGLYPDASYPTSQKYWHSHATIFEAVLEKVRESFINQSQDEESVS